MPRTTELPGDLDVDELNDMIADLAHEMGCPYDVSPESVELGEIPIETYGLNRGCVRDGVTLYKEGQRWRRRLMKELKQRPEWIASWRARQALNQRLRDLCEVRRYQFTPWECHPADAPDDLPEGFNPQDSVWAQSLPQAVRLRRALIRELEAEGA